MPARKKVEDPKMTVSSDPPTDPGVGIVPSTRAAGGGGVGGGAPAVAAAGTYPGGYSAWVVPAPAAAATAPVGSSGYYMGIQLGVDPTPGALAMLGTSAPRAGWPN